MFAVMIMMMMIMTLKNFLNAMIHLYDSIIMANDSSVLISICFDEFPLYYMYMNTKQC